MSSTERKNFLQHRTSTAAERASYRAAARKAKADYYKTPEGREDVERIAQAHREYMETIR